MTFVPTLRPQRLEGHLKGRNLYVRSLPGRSTPATPASPAYFPHSCMEARSVPAATAVQDESDSAHTNSSGVTLNQSVATCLSASPPSPPQYSPAPPPPHAGPAFARAPRPPRRLRWNRSLPQSECAVPW